MCVYINRRRYFYSRKSLPKPLRKPHPQPNYSLSPNHLQPHPQPLSEWRGEWRLLVGWERMVSRNRGNCVLELRKQPHPRPLSEWRGAWILLVGWERMVSENRGNYILELKKRPSRFEEGVSLCRKEPLLASKRRPLYLQTIVFTPLSIRRGVGGEAVSFYFSTLLITLPFDSLRMLIPFAGVERRLPFKS